MGDGKQTDARLGGEEGVNMESEKKEEKIVDPIAKARRAASKCRARAADMRLKAEELEQNAAELEAEYRKILHDKGGVDAIG